MFSFIQIVMNVNSTIMDVNTVVLTLLAVIHAPAELAMNYNLINAIVLVISNCYSSVNMLNKINITDINECSRGTDLCEHNCHNTIGSYYCSCDTGYFLTANGYSCHGIYIL